MIDYKKALDISNQICQMYPNKPINFYRSTDKYGVIIHLGNLKSNNNVFNPFIRSTDSVLNNSKFKDYLKNNQQFIRDHYVLRFYESSYRTAFNARTGEYYYSSTVGENLNLATAFDVIRHILRNRISGTDTFFDYIVPHFEEYKNNLKKTATKDKEIKCITIDIDSNNFSYTNIKESELVKLSKNDNFMHLNSKARLKSLFLVKLKDPEQSSLLFGFKTLKNKMFKSGKLFKINVDYPAYVCKKDEKVRDMIEVIYEGRAYKFLAEELEFVGPFDLVEKMLKSYNEPKDRTLKVKSKVKIIDDRKIPLKRDTVGTVTKLNTLGKNKVYASLKVEDKEYLINIKQLKVT